HGAAIPIAYHFTHRTATTTKAAHFPSYSSASLYLQITPDIRSSTSHNRSPSSTSTSRHHNDDKIIRYKNPTPSDSGGDGIGGGAIAGMAVGVLAVLIGSIVGGFLLLKQRRKRLMHVGKNNRRNSGYPEFDPHRHSSSDHHNRRRYDRGDTGVGYGRGGYYYGDGSLPSSSSRARTAEGTIGIYDEKSFHAAKAGVGGPRLLPTSTGSTSSLDRDALRPGDRYSQYNKGRYVGAGHRTGGGGEGGYYPPFAPGAPGMLKDMPGDHRDSRTQSVVLDSQQLERERELDLQQQARMLSMADAENPLRPMSGVVLKNPPGGSYNQHSQYSQKQPPTQQYYYDDGYGNYGEYDGEYDGQYGEYDDGYYNAQWGPGRQDTAYGRVPDSQQPQNSYGSQNPYPKAEGYTQQQQQQEPSPSPRKSRDNVTATWQDVGQAPLEQGPTIAAMSNASAVSGSESMVHSPTTAGTSPVDEVMPSMGTDFVMNRQELLQQQLHQQQLYQQQQQQIYNISGQIDGGDDAEGKEEYRLSVHVDGKKSSVNHDSGKEEYRLSQHGNGYQVPETPTPAAGEVLVAADVRATAESGVGATPPPLPILTKPRKALQGMRG
ncbi:hypothetical protein BGZ75_003805, partial [Mortierella antarctica]